MKSSHRTTSRPSATEAGRKIFRTETGSVYTMNLKDSADEITGAWARFGYDEPNFTYMPDGKKLLNRKHITCFIH